MNLNLYEILPEEVSDEEASHLVNIFMNLALAIESHYYVQIKRHLKATSPESADLYNEGSSLPLLSSRKDICKIS